MLAPILNAVRTQRPRIHSITNTVSAPLSANGLIAIGAAPIMAEDLEEVAQITTGCDGLCLNLGTPNPRKLQAMVEAGITANALGHPVVFDPVAVGGSDLRLNGAKRILKTVRCTVIRGNLTEMKTLAHGQRDAMGVDAGMGDAINDQTLAGVVVFAQDFAAELGTILAISGAMDVVTDGTTTYIIRNGHPMLSAVSGSGCLLSAITAAYLSANPDQPLLAVVASLCTMGYCGEQAAITCHGNGSFAVDLLDELSNVTGETLELGAKYALYQR